MDIEEKRGCNQREYNQPKCNQREVRSHDMLEEVEGKPRLTFICGCECLNCSNSWSRRVGSINVGR